MIKERSPLLLLDLRLGTIVVRAFHCHRQRALAHDRRGGVVPLPQANYGNGCQRSAQRPKSEEGPCRSCEKPLPTASCSWGHRLGRRYHRPSCDIHMAVTRTDHFQQNCLGTVGTLVQSFSSPDRGTWPRATVLWDSISASTRRILQ